MKKILAIALAAMMLLAVLAGCGSSASSSAESAAAEERTSFVMGIDPEYPPFSYLGDDGSYTGFDVEVCQAVCDYLGWELEVFGVNWDEKLVQLDSFECDCVWSGMTILDSMKEAGYVISEPYYDNTQVLVVKADSGFASSADLAGKLVAVQLGTSGEALLNGDLADMAETFGGIVTCDSCSNNSGKHLARGSRKLDVQIRQISITFSNSICIGICCSVFTICFIFNG